jgi:hypothetical protein
MNPQLTLCEHFAAPGFASLAVRPDDMLEWYDGPVDAVVRCEACGSAAIVAMLDWSPSCDVRVYGLAALDPAAIALFMRDRARGSCDVARLGNELHALVSAAGRAERVIAVDVRIDRVLANVPCPGERGIPTGDLAARLPPVDDTRWFDLVGRPKQTTDSRDHR